MEKVIAVDLVIDSGDSLNELKLVEDKLNLIEQSIKEVNSSDDKGLENQMKALNNVVEENNLNWSELGKTIEQYQNIALASGKSSPIGKEALRKAGELKSEMDNLTRSVNSLATNGQNLNTALQFSGGVVAGYTAVQSVTALIGEENEELIKTLVKLQSAQGLLASIEQVRFALEKDSLIALKAKTIWEKAVAISTTLMTKANLINTTATNGATVSTKIFTVALLAVPFVAIVAGLVLLYQNFDKVSAAVKDSIKWFSELKESSKVIRVLGDVAYSVIEPFVLLFQAIQRGLQMIGVLETEAEKVIREKNEAIIKGYQDRGKEIDVLIDKHAELTSSAINDLNREIALRKAQGKDTIDLEREKLEIIEQSALQEIKLSKLKLEAYSAEIKLKVKNKELDQEALDQEIEAINEMAVALKDRVNNYKDAKNTMLVFESQLIKDRRDKQTEAFTQRKETLRNELEELAQIEKDFSDLERQRVLDEILEDAEKKKALEDEIATMSDEMDMPISEEDAQLEADLLIEEQNRKHNEQLLLDDAEAQKKKIANINNGLKTSMEALNMLSSLNQAFLQNDLAKAGNNEAKKEQLRKASFEREKKLNIARAVINGAMAVMQALANMPPPLSYIMAGGSAVLAGVQIAAISKQKYNSSGSIPSISSNFSTPSISSGSSGGETQSSNPITTTDVSELISQNNTTNQVLVVDDFNKVNNNQNLIEAASTI